MYTKGVELFKLIIEFSYVIGVTPPRTADIGQWWDVALKEMDDFWVFNLLEIGAFTQNSGRLTQIMRQKLVNEAENRRLVNTLA